MNTLLKGTLLAGLAAVGVVAAAHAQQSGDGFSPASLDADGDGVVSTAELDTHADLLFARTDRDHDDRLSADELRALHAMMPAGVSMEHARDQAPAPVNRQAFREGLRGRAVRMDANRDGRLTVAEVGAAMHGGQAH